jgi:hypothetical protein
MVVSAPSARSDPLQSLVASNTAFGLNLYAQLATNPGKRPGCSAKPRAARMKMWVCSTICGTIWHNPLRFESLETRLFAGGLASPLRFATGGSASWRLEARCRRSPAPCESNGAGGPRASAGSGDHMFRRVDLAFLATKRALRASPEGSTTHRFCYGGTIPRIRMAMAISAQRSHSFHFCSFLGSISFRLPLEFKAKTLSQSPSIRLPGVVLNHL